MRNTKKPISIIISLVMLIGVVLGVSITSFAGDAPNNSVSLTVGDNIVSHYYIDTEYYRNKGCDSLQYSYNGTNEKEEYNKVESDVINLGSESEYVIDAYQAPAQIAEPTTIKIFKDGAVYDTVSYSSMTYCNQIININPEDYASYGITKGPRLATLCKTLVTYGKSAQEAFNYSASTVQGATTIESDYSDELEIASASFTPSTSKTAGENVSFKTASFLCTSSAKMRFYLNINDETDTTDYGEPVVTAPQGVTCQKGYVEDGANKIYFLELCNIKPVDFDYDLKIEYAGASVEMSVLDYAGAVINSSAASAQMKKLAKTVIVYNAKAESFFNGPEHITEYVEASPASCTANGVGAHYVCTECGKLFSDEDGNNEVTAESLVITKLGHDLGEFTQTTAPTCTEKGAERADCSRCDYYETREIPANGHTEKAAANENVVNATCTTAGSYDEVVRCSVCNEIISSTPHTVAALGHSFTNYVSNNNATCTADGTKTATCDRCTETNTITNEGSALGHSPATAVQENVVNATCTTAGSYDEVVYCSRCEAKLSSNHVTVNALGHSYGSWSVTTGATLTTSGTETRTCTRNCGTSETRTVQNFTFKLPNTDAYLYRVGNSNTVTLGTFFDNESGADITGISVTTSKDAGNATCTYTANAEDWRNGTLKFNNTGIMTVTLKHGTTTVKTFKLEVVAGNNITSGTLGNRNSNVILLGDVDAAKNTTINGGATVYGNGFAINDVRTDTSGGAGAYLILNGGATIDNAVMMGKVYSNVVDSGTTNQEYAPGIYINGNANIYNSYVREAKYAVEIEGTGVVNLENSTFEGGTLASVAILGGADVTMKDCTTVTSTNGKKGLAVMVMNSSAKLHLVGKLDQYNMLPSGGTNLPSTYKNVIDSMYTSANSAYMYNNYMNLGVFFITANQPGISQTVAQEILDIDDFDYKNSYGYLEKTSAGFTGTLYTTNSSLGATMMTAPSPVFTPRTYGQHPVVPQATFNYTLAANYDAKADTDDKTYCYGETKGTTNRVYISFENGSSKVFTPQILNVTKNGATINPSSITMNGVNYTNSTYTFTTAGDYEFIYTYTDSGNYDKDGNAYSVTYTKKLKVNVVTPEPDAQTYHPEFTYPNIGDTTSKSVVADNKTYIMPNVSATSDSIGSTTVGGQTIYYPIINCPGRNSGNTSDYSSGEIWYFAPAFTEINIKDKNASTGATLYTYNQSSTKWPHDVAATTRPTTDGDYYGYVSTFPWTSHSGDTGRTAGTVSNLGLCYKSGGFTSDRNAATMTTTFYYKGNDGVTYYYIIQYKYPAVTHKDSTCVAEGSLITMADGTQKAIEDVKVGDMVMTWNFHTGSYEAQPVILHWNHGNNNHDVLNLKFSDGTITKVIYEHAFYDSDINNFVYFRTDSNMAENYIGDKFIKFDENGNRYEVELVDYEITEEDVYSYTLMTAYNLNFVVENILSSNTELEHPGMFDFFEINDDMIYDEEKMQADIEKYGLYTYDDFKDVCTEEQFELIGLKYFKVTVGRGAINLDELKDIIRTYLEEGLNNE